MGLRGRIGLVTALAAGAIVLAASVVTYLVVRDALRGQVDEALTAQADLAERVGATGSRPFPRPGDEPVRIPAPPPALGAPTAIQIVTRRGDVVNVGPRTVRLPITAADRSAAEGTGGRAFTIREIDGARLRVLTAPIGDRGAVLLARSLNGVDDVLRTLALVLGALTLLSVALGFLLGRLLAGRALRPVADLTTTVEHVEATGDLSRRVGATSGDEVGRLATRFNAMLGRLQATGAERDASIAAQRRLVADASHELRTPVTSLRTNAEVLRERPDLAPGERAAILDDVVAQADELGTLVGDLIEVARDEQPIDAELEIVRLDELAAEAVERARRHAPGLDITLDAEPCLVRVTPARVGRALNNLLDNAARHGAPPIVVRVSADGELHVRDHGRGIPPEELPFVFDRFFRGAATRETPGTGLGLSIVRQVAEAHGGSAAAGAPADGGPGALLVVRLPVAAAALAPAEPQAEGSRS